MRVTVTGQTPDEKADAGEDEHAADDVSLLGLDLSLELEPDDGDHATERDRGQHVAPCGKEGRPGETRHAPFLSPGDHRQRDPVVGQDRMHDADGRSAHKQEANGGQMHAPTVDDWLSIRSYVAHSFQLVQLPGREAYLLREGPVQWRAPERERGADRGDRRAVSLIIPPRGGLAAESLRARSAKRLTGLPPRDLFRSARPTHADGPSRRLPAVARHRAERLFGCVDPRLVGQNDDSDVPA